MTNKRGPERKSLEFWREAIRRMQGGERVSVLAEELGVQARRLYRWRRRLALAEQDPQRQGEGGLAQEVRQLKQALAEKVLEVDFLRGALHKVEGRRQKNDAAGGPASTTRSGK